MIQKQITDSEDEKGGVLIALRPERSMKFTNWREPTKQKVRAKGVLSFKEDGGERDHMNGTEGNQGIANEAMGKSFERLPIQKANRALSLWRKCKWKLR